jgi:predicted nuclease with TOPRIM domain
MENDANTNDVSVQIENYKNALVKMRDIVTTANFERADMQHQYEQCREEYQRLQTENDKLVNELSQVYDEVAGLHEQVKFGHVNSYFLFSWTMQWEAAA